MNIREFRSQYPQYDSVSDDVLARKLHEKFYADVRFETFNSSFVPKAAVAQSNILGLEDAAPEIMDNWVDTPTAGAPTGKGPAGFLEEFGKDPIKFMPVGGSTFRAARNQHLEAAKWRLENDAYSGEVEPKGHPGFAPPFGGAHAVPRAAGETAPISQREVDVQTIVQDEARRAEEAERGVSFSGKVGGILGEMPAIVGEAAGTGSLSSGARTAVQKGIERTALKAGVGRFALSRSGQFATGAAARVAGAATRAIAGTPGRVAQSYSERRMPQGFSFSEEGKPVFQWPDENPATSFAKAWGDVTIEWFSEEFGDLELTPKVAQAVFKRLKGKKYAGKVVDKLYRAYQKIKPDATKLEFVKQAFALGGVHGLVDEVGEEYLGAALRSATGVSDQSMGEALWEQVRETPAMLTAFSVLPAAKWSMASLAGKPFDWSQLEGEEHPEELLNWYEPTPRVMPEADVEDAVADTAVASEFHPEGLRKPKEVTPEERQVLERLEGEEVETVGTSEQAPTEEEGTVAPKLYIGNVTKRAKEAWAEMFEQARQADESVPVGGKRSELVEGEAAGKIKAEDVGPHTEKGRPTKRTGV